MSLSLLRGTRVISLEQYIAGPYCTSVLADAGAEVIKIEQPGSGDPRRSYEPQVGAEGGRISAGFAPYNRGKRSVELDIRSAEGSAHLGELLATADVLVSNLRPGALSRAGWDTDRLKSEFPDLVVCEITGFGASGGPYSQWPAFDSVIQAMSGLSSLLGTDSEAPPGLAPMSTMDLLAGLYAALGISMALAARRSGAPAVHVDASMYDIGAAFLLRPLSSFDFTGVEETRGVDNFSPVAAFRTGEGTWVSIVIPTDEMWRRTCSVVNDAELENDPGLATTIGRARRMGSVIVPALERWAAGMSAAEATQHLRLAGQPAGVVQSIAEVRDCPQLAHRGLFVPLDVDEPRADHRGPISVPRLPLLFDGAGADNGHVPRLGEDNAQLVPAYAIRKAHP